MDFIKLKHLLCNNPRKEDAKRQATAREETFVKSPRKLTKCSGEDELIQSEDAQKARVGIPPKMIY